MLSRSLAALVGINLVSLAIIAAIIELYGSGSAVVPMMVPGWFYASCWTITQFDLFLLPLLLSWLFWLFVRE